MKLKNKKTGKTVEWFNNTDGIFPNSLAELNEEWEDVPEELKECWYIDCDGGVFRLYIFDEGIKEMKLIGNYFETQEEAEKAVEKLKAWKRLEDRGFRLNNYKSKYNLIADTDKKWELVIFAEINSDVLDDEDGINDLNLILKGEENE